MAEPPEGWDETFGILVDLARQADVLLRPEKLEVADISYNLRRCTSSPFFVCDWHVFPPPLFQSLKNYVGIKSKERHCVVRAGSILRTFFFNFLLHFFVSPGFCVCAQCCRNVSAFFPPGSNEMKCLYNIIYGKGEGLNTPSDIAAACARLRALPQWAA